MPTTVHAAILAINQAIEQGSPAEDLIKLLRGLAAGLENVEDQSKQAYRQELMEARGHKATHAAKKETAEEKDIYDTNLTQIEIQKVLNMVNAMISAESKRVAFETAITAINAAIVKGDAAATLRALQNPAADLTDVEEDTAFQYQVTLSEMIGGNELTQGQIQDGVDEANAAMAEQHKVDNALASIRSLVQSDNAAELLTALRDSQQLLELPEIGDYALEYLAALKAATDGEPHELYQKKVQEGVQQVNCSKEQEARLLLAVASVNQAVDADVAADTLVALQNPDLGLQGVDPAGAVHYQYMLGEIKQKSGGLPLSCEQIQQTVTQANTEAEENAKHAAAIFLLNETVRAGNAIPTLAALQDRHARVQEVREACALRYQEILHAALVEKEMAAGGKQSKWKRFVAKDGRPYFANKETKESSWLPPDELNDALLNLADIQDGVDRGNAAEDRGNLFKANEDKIVDLQAKIRGYLTRKAFKDRKAYLDSQGDAVLKLQAAARGHQQRKRYNERLAFLKSQVAAVLKVQAAWKGHKVRNQYTNLTKVTDPPVATVRKFLHLLDQSELDLSEELQLQHLKEKVVKEIKHNHELEHNLNQMDIKIGLLVRNRIEIQDVVKQSKLLKKQNAMAKGVSKDDFNSALANLKSLNKEARDRLESYQHMFYLLQTEPAYFASLVFVEQPLERWSAHKAATFLQHVIQTTYNYASNAREKYLLNKLYRTALRKEVFEKITAVKEFITGNPTVVKLIINHHRGSGSENYMADALVPLIPNLLAEPDLDLNTDPVEVYKRYINKQEAETGEKSTLPYEVEREEALKTDFVRDHIETTMRKLLELVALFQDTIINGVAKLPYGLRYICKCLRQDLREKFPDVPEDDILKVLGNVLYYRYLNPAIIAPEAFGVIEVSMQEGINQTQRRNLASIARVLQFAASGQKFDEDLAHMSLLNKFLNESWLKFKRYFELATDVVSSEEHFNIDEYSDVTMLAKPVIYISQKEIFHTHELLAANLAEVAPAADDPLREILQDLGEVGDETTVLGPEGSSQYATSKAEISLTLANKFEVPEEEDASTKALFVRTKRMVVDVIRFQQGKNLKNILDTPASAEEETEHQKHAASRAAHESALREAQNAGSDAEALRRMNSSSGGGAADGTITATLTELKEKIKSNAVLLEKEGLCSLANNYQDLLNSVAQDIRNQRIYRRQRKQELSKLHHTLEDLGKKRLYFSDQVESYDLYVQMCMSELAKGACVSTPS